MSLFVDSFILPVNSNSVKAYLRFVDSGFLLNGFKAFE
jgi:hypothetical protein